MTEYSAPPQIPPVGTYWKRPATRAVGDSDIDLIYKAVGRAIVQWEEAEFSLANVFGVLLGAEYWAATSVFGSLMNIRAKGEAVTVSAHHFFRVRSNSAADQELLDLAVKHYSEASTLRNDVAHATIINYAESGHFLSPPMYSQKGVLAAKVRLNNSFGLLGAYAYTSADIEDIAARFSVLANWLFHLRGYLASKYPARA